MVLNQSILVLLRVLHRVVPYLQHCSCFFVDGLMKEPIESEASFLPSLQLKGFLFAEDFVGLSDSKEGLQDMINVVNAYSKKWRFEANVTKCSSFQE